MIWIVILSNLVLCKLGHIDLVNFLLQARVLCLQAVKLKLHGLVVRVNDSGVGNLGLSLQKIGVNAEGLFGGLNMHEVSFCRGSHYMRRFLREKTKGPEGPKAFYSSCIARSLTLI